MVRLLKSVEEIMCFWNRWARVRKFEMFLLIYDYYGLFQNLMACVPNLEDVC